MSIERRNSERIEISPFDTVEGVDFMWDYYAILGIDSSASEDDIKAALRDLKAKNHPDRMQHVDDEYRKKAEKKWAFMEKVEAVLLDPEKRSQYDKMLSEFDPKLVSTKWGTSIWNPLRRKVDVDMLAADFELPPLSKLEHKFEIESSHDPKSFEAIEKLYMANPDDPNICGLYRAALEKKLDYYNSMEQAAWMRAGVMDIEAPKKRLSETQHLNDYVDNVLTEIDRVLEEEIPRVIQQRVKGLLAGVSTPLQLTDGSDMDQSVQESPENAPDVADQVRDKIASTFKGRTDEIKQVAEEKVEVLRALFDASDYEYIKREEAPGEQCLVVMTHGGAVLFAVLAEGASGQSIEVDGSVEELKELHQDKDLLFIEYNPNVPSISMQLYYIYEKVTGTGDEV